MQSVDLPPLARHLACRRPEDSGASVAGAAKAEARKRVMMETEKRMVKSD